MVYIFTGCDRSGKTTLAKRLSKELNGEYIHFSAPKSLEDGKKEYYNFISSINDKTYILDRFYECEDIYAPIYRNYSLNYQDDIEQLLNCHNVMFIYVKTPLDIIKERIKKCGENFVKWDDLQKVIDNYELFFAKTKIPYIIVSGDYKDINVPINIIKKKMNQLIILKQFYKKHNSFSYGNLTSDIIVINENDNNVRDIDDLTYMWISNKTNYDFDASVLNKYEFIFHRKD